MQTVGQEAFGRGVTLETLTPIVALHSLGYPKHPPERAPLRCAQRMGRHLDERRRSAHGWRLRAHGSAPPTQPLHMEPFALREHGRRQT